MPDPLDGRLFIEHLLRRWRLPALTLAVALAASLTLSLVQTRRYTAQVSLVIDPPVTSDPRAAMAVSPIYLESLRTYEHYASSDHLFAEAMKKFGLRGAGWRPVTIESLKRSVLQVSVLRNTKILEIAVTLPDPSKAHALAVYIAEQTIALNRATSRRVDDELADAARREVDRAAAKLQAAQSALRAGIERAPARETLGTELKRLDEGAADTERESPSALRTRPGSARIPSSRLQRESPELAALMLLAGRKTEVDLLFAEYKAARDALDQTERSLRERQGLAGYRTESITLLDPGVAPERPSSPNIPWNLFAAATLALIASLVYLTVEFGLQSHRPENARKLSRVAAKS